MAELRSRFEMELRSRDQALRETFERQQLQLQQQWENALAEKDKEMASLLTSLNELNQVSLESTHRARALESETHKRRELEDRLRTSMTELANTQTHLQESTIKHEGILQYINRQKLRRNELSHFGPVRVQVAI